MQAAYFAINYRTESVTERVREATHGNVVVEIP